MSTDSLPKPNHTNPPSETNTPDARFFSALLGLYTYSDSVMWGRVRSLGVIQGGAIAAAYTLRGHPAVGAGIFSFALLLTVILLLMMLRDKANRDANNDLLVRLGESLSSAVGKDAPQFKLEIPTSAHTPYRVTHLNIFAFGLFMLLDITGIGYCLCRFFCA